jgi:cytidylate kinase
MSLITISKSLGCGSCTIAGIVANELKLELYDRQRFQQEATKIGISSADLDCLAEKVPSIFERLFGNKSQLYNDLMGCMVYELARRGNGIIIGCGNQLFLKQFSSVLKVLLCASECCRKEHLMDWHDLTEAEAEKIIRKCDRERKAFLRCIGHPGCDDPSHFDVVIDTEKIDMERAIDLILKTANSDKFKQCNEQELEVIERLALKKRIKATLLKSNLKRSILQLDVPENGVAHIKGWTNTQGTYDRVIDILNRVPGVIRVQSDIAVGCWTPKVLVQRKQVA